MLSQENILIELLLERESLLGRKNHIEFLNGIGEKINNEIDSYITLMKNFNIEGSGNRQRYDAIKLQFDHAMERRDKQGGEIDALWKVQNKESEIFTKKCIDSFFDISETMPDLVLSVRDELDLKIPEEEYRGIYGNNINRGREVFKNFLDRV